MKAIGTLGQYQVRDHGEALIPERRLSADQTDRGSARMGEDVCHPLGEGTASRLRLEERFVSSHPLASAAT